MFKEEITQYCPMCQEWAEKYEKLKAENMEYFESINDINKKIDKYENALQEIKEIAEKHTPRCIVSCPKDNYECEACLYADLEEILQKISEVEDGKK